MDKKQQGTNNNINLCISVEKTVKRSSELHSNKININATKKGTKTKNEEPIIHHHLTLVS